MTRSLEGKTALVVGASGQGDIASGVIRAFARQGANLAIVGRSKGKLGAFRDVENFGAHVLLLCVRDATADAIGQAVKKAVDEFGRIDVLVNCAQFAKAGTTLAELAQGDLEAALDLSLRVPFQWMQAGYPHLREAKGSVVNFGSLAAHEGVAGMGALAAAKEGLFGLSKVAAAEWEPDGIRVNMLCARARTTSFERIASQMENAMAFQVEGQLASLDEVGKACVELACGEVSGGLFSVTSQGMTRVE